jgi:cytochrome P450
LENLVEVDGYILPKDSVIICNMDSIHKNVERYPDPLTFIPDRFMNNLKTMQSAANGKLEERDHFNFGWGRYVHQA